MTANSSAHAIRLLCRTNHLTAQTSGLANGHIQANLIVLPSSVASDFRRLCLRNPVPCPLLAASASPGDPHTLDVSGWISHDLDIRTDIPKYNIYRDGKLIETKLDIRREWTDDHVAFLIGCSFSFEAALDRAGLVPRHWTMGCNVPMYKTMRPLNPSGIFSGSCYVVSMRPYKFEEIEKVREVTRPFVEMHGEPIAWGWEAVKELGIRDIDRPEFGDRVQIREGEVPVFWGCGVTPQVAVMEAGPLIEGTVMGHTPGHMLILDMKDDCTFK